MRESIMNTKFRLISAQPSLLLESRTLSPIGGTTVPEGTKTSSAARRAHHLLCNAQGATGFPSNYTSKDTSNPFKDFDAFSEQLPGVKLKISVSKYWTKGHNRQPICVLCQMRSKDGNDGDVCFVELFGLVSDGLVQFQHAESKERKK